MKLKEAYATLGLSETATPEEAKKKYRDLTKQYHPDISKEPDAEEKFKKINQAYQIVQNGEEVSPYDQARQSVHSPFNPFNDYFHNQQKSFHPADNISISTTISFKESVLGCKKDIKYSRQTKCKDCNGQGKSPINNGCTTCGGKGQVMFKRGNTMFFQQCDKCHGRTQTTNCPVCSAKGIMNVEASVSVSIPGGIKDGNILRLHDMGHYVGSSFMFMDQHTDVHLQVKVNPELGLSIDGMHVVSALEVSLLEALQGCEKKIKTIDGSQIVKVSPLTRHHDEIVIPKMGVNRLGDQKVIMNVKYPKNTDALIEVLNKEN